MYIFKAIATVTVGHWAYWKPGLIIIWDCYQINIAYVANSY